MDIGTTEAAVWPVSSILGRRRDAECGEMQVHACLLHATDKPKQTSLHKSLQTPSKMMPSRKKPLGKMVWMPENHKATFLLHKSSSETVILSKWKEEEVMMEKEEVEEEENGEEGGRRKKRREWRRKEDKKEDKW